MSGTLWLIAPGDVRRVARRLRKERVVWCHLGASKELESRAARAFSRAARVFIGEELNQVAERVRQPFLDWMTAMGSKQNDPSIWWSSRLGSRSTLQTDIFLLVCHDRLVHGWLDRGKQGDTLVAVIEDPWLLWMLARRLMQDERVRFLNSGWWGVLRDAAGRLARAPYVMARFFLWSVWSNLQVRRSFPEKSGCLSGTDQKSILIYTWIDERSFSGTGDLQDPYTGRLADILSSHGEHVRRFTPIQMGVRRGWLRELKARSACLMATPRYVRVGDIVWSVSRYFRINELRRLSQFQGWNYAPLLYRELFHEWGEGEFAGYQLWYRAMRRFARSERKQIKTVVYPFENQPWEKMLCLAFRQEASAVRLVGYQHSNVTPMMLNYALGRGEDLSAPLPDRIVTNGQLGLKILREAGFPAWWLINGGALRFEHLFGMRGKAAQGKVLPQDRRRVVVGLPIMPLVAQALLRSIVEVFREPCVGDKRKCPVEFVLKCHPRLPIERLVSPSERLPEWLKVSERPLSDLLETADVFLYSPPSVMGWEAFLMGVPVLKYKDSSHDGLLDSDRGDPLTQEVMCCSAETLRDKLGVLLQDEHCKTKQANRQDFLRQIFSPVDERVWIRLIEDSGPGEADVVPEGEESHSERSEDRSQQESATVKEQVSG